MNDNGINRTKLPKVNIQPLDTFTFGIVSSMRVGSHTSVDGLACVSLSRSIGVGGSASGGNVNIRRKNLNLKHLDWLTSSREKLDMPRVGIAVVRAALGRSISRFLSWWMGQACISTIGITAGLPRIEKNCIAEGGVVPELVGVIRSVVAPAIVTHVDPPFWNALGDWGASGGGGDGRGLYRHFSGLGGPLSSFGSLGRQCGGGGGLSGCFCENALSRSVGSLRSLGSYSCCS